MTLLEEPFELRNAYILELTPKAASFGNLRGLVFVDTEAYVWLAAEFFDASERTAVAVPLWRSHPSPAGGNLFDLAGEFYIPSRQPPMSAKGRAQRHSEAERCHEPELSALVLPYAAACPREFRPEN